MNLYKISFYLSQIKMLLFPYLFCTGSERTNKNVFSSEKDA